MASLELLGKLYVQGGHRLDLGYTYLRGNTSDKGRLRALPENWFSLAGVWFLSGNRLTATTILRVTGAAEDPNRLVEYRGSRYHTCPAADPSCSLGPKPGTPRDPVTVAATDLVLDRLPPIADARHPVLAWLQAGDPGVRLQCTFQPYVPTGRVLRLRAPPGIFTQSLRRVPGLPVDDLPVLR